MKEPFAINDLRVNPGTRLDATLAGVELADGTLVRMPLVVVNGAHSGPTLAVIAGVHGNEISGIGAIHGVLAAIDPERLHGQLLAVPGANPLALQVGAYRTPIDGVNLSGPWYLQPGGSESLGLTQRLARSLDPVLRAADYVIDMHANPLPSIPFVLTDLEVCRDERVRDGIRLMASAFGTTVINWPRNHATSLRDICAVAGKPALTPELAGNTVLAQESVSVGTRGILNVMRALGQVEGPIEPQAVETIPGPLRFFGWLVAQRGGLMRVHGEPGVQLAKGEVAVEIVDFYGHTKEEVRMPVRGYCWAFTGGVGGSHAVGEGDRLAYVFAHEREFDPAGGFVERPA
jgi:uncharacterized protein